MALSHDVTPIDDLGWSLFRIAIGATPFLLPLMFQTGFRVNAFNSGLLVPFNGLRRQSITVCQLPCGNTEYGTGAKYSAWFTGLYFRLQKDGTIY
jgi:hypothetical protein